MPTIVLRDTEGGVFDLKKFPDYRTKLTKAGAEAIALRLESKGLLRVGEQQWVVDAVGGGLGLCLRLPDGACS